MTKTYTELLALPSFEERFKYLELVGRVGEITFGHERVLNQGFYKSREWRNLRYEIIVRDENCDLACWGYEITTPPIIHHMNPMTRQQVRDGIPDIVNPEYLITVSHRTHNAIHYGDESQLPREFVERTEDDHIPWRRG